MSVSWRPPHIKVTKRIALNTNIWSSKKAPTKQGGDGQDD